MALYYSAPLPLIQIRVLFPVRSTSARARDSRMPISNILNGKVTGHTPFANFVADARLLLNRHIVARRATPPICNFALCVCARIIIIAFNRKSLLLAAIQYAIDAIFFLQLWNEN